MIVQKHDFRVPMDQEKSYQHTFPELFSNVSMDRNHPKNTSRCLWDGPSNLNFQPRPGFKPRKRVAQGREEVGGHQSRAWKSPEKLIFGLEIVDIVSFILIISLYCSLGEISVFHR